MTRSSQEIVDQTHALAEDFYKEMGYVHERDKHGNLYDSTHPTERLMWKLACMAQIELTDTDPDDALTDLEEPAND